MLSPELWAAIKPTFIQRAPLEAVVAVWADDSWEELNNLHRAPEGSFELSAADTVRLHSKPLLVLLHSHIGGCPDGLAEVSDMDSLMQQASGLTWGIVAVVVSEANEVLRIDAPEYFGPGAPRAPLLGRRYLWGIRDCFALMRDWYFEQGIFLPDVPRLRNAAAYPDSHPYAHDYFAYWAKELGFTEIQRHERQPGDAVTTCVNGSRVANNIMIYCGEGKYLCQSHTRASCVDQIDLEERYLERESATFYRLGGVSAEHRSTWQF